jgi:predicted TIM-barrel fold metal-dependent hydrolase
LEAPPPLDIIDCHTHFYDPSRPEGVPFPAKGSPIYRTVLPEHLRAQKMFRRVTGTVIVEASPWVEDNAWLLNLAEKDPFVVGIIGRLEPGSPSFATDLKRFAANPLYRGIRISEKALEQLLETGALGDLQLLADHDLALDVNGGGAVVARLAKRLPSLRIVLNHTGHAPVSESGPTPAWIEAIQAAASQPNVYCKVSHLVRTALHEAKGPGTPALDFYRPYLDAVWKAFGEDRVIYASNWPVSDSISDYETLERIALQYAFEKGDEATRKFCALNAKRAYHWIERPNRRCPSARNFHFPATANLRTHGEPTPDHINKSSFATEGRRKRTRLAGFLEAVR